MSATRIRKLIETGIFAVNKPKGITSAALLNELKDIINRELVGPTLDEPIRMGHGGTLDSSATGVLAVGVNMGCKKLPYLLHGEKTYTTVGKLGAGTDTYNDIGKIVEERPYDHVLEADLKQELKKYVGEIEQIPPVYSALKVNRRRYSDLVREGMEVTPKARKVVCMSAKCLKYDPPLFTLEVRCGGGFYIRSLVNDLGKDLNTCAHVVELDRTQHGPFTLADSLDSSNWSVEKILDSILHCNMKFNQYYHLHAHNRVSSR